MANEVPSSSKSQNARWFLATIIPMGVLVALFGVAAGGIDDTDRITPKADVGVTVTVYDENFDDTCNEAGDNADLASSTTEVSLVDETGKVVGTTTAGVGEYGDADGISCTWYVRFNVVVPLEYGQNLGDSAGADSATEDTVASDDETFNEDETFTEDTTATDEESFTEDTTATVDDTTTDTTMDTTNTAVPAAGPKFTVKFGKFAEQTYSLTQFILGSSDETGPRIVIGTPKK